MIKKSTVDEILFGKVATVINQRLSEVGFKYQKSKKQFLRQQNGFDHLISLHSANSAIYFDKDADEIYLSFYLLPEIIYPAYDKWFLDATGDHSSPRLYEHPVIGLRMQLEFEDFSEESFYAPTLSQQFKMTVARELGGSPDTENTMLLEDFMKDPLAVLLQNLSDHSDVQKLYEVRKHPLMHTFLLVFAGAIDRANTQLDLLYAHYLDSIKERLAVSQQEARSYLQNFDQFILHAQKLAGRTFPNPFTQSANRMAGQNEQLLLSEKTRFHELLRLDVSELQLHHTILVDKEGSVLLLANNTRILKYSVGGELLLDKKLEAPKGFDKLFNLEPGYLNDTDEFFVNNFILTRDNQLITLPLPLTKKKGKQLPSPRISDLAYHRNEDKYLVIFDGKILTYSRSGVLEKEIPALGSRIIPEQEWILAALEDKANVIHDFTGQRVGEFEYAHGNRKSIFSDDFQYLVCYGYSTKSQFYDLKNNKKDTLWAHPTFVKDYKETMYNDIENNFGMEIAAFSPDNKYLVGAAYHGKYVAWSLPKLERTELIPAEDTFEMLARRDTTYSPDGSQSVKLTLPSIVALDGQTFFKNRGNIPYTLFFIDNGDRFCMNIERSDLLLIWDRDFKYVGHLQTRGYVQLHGDRYLTRFFRKDHEGSEVILYRKSS
jgi:hypothetical protein